MNSVSEWQLHVEEVVVGRFTYALAASCHSLIICFLSSGRSQIKGKHQEILSPTIL